MEEWQLRQKQSLPLEQKIIMSQRRITEWYNHYGGQVYVSFSGGKDSTVLLHLVRELYPDAPALFIDTGLEYPEIRQFVSAIDNVDIRKPKINFREVVLTRGYPIISKEVSNCVRQARKSIAAGDGNTYRVRRIQGTLKGPDGQPSKYNIPQWGYLVDAPFLISEECCSLIKKDPANRYGQETGRVPILGVMACESQLRRQKWLQNGCNGFSMKKPVSNPLSFWTEQDILKYIKRVKLPYASVYGAIVTTSRGDLATTELNRTGCMFCAFGAHLEKGTNRFQRMSRTHPKQYDYCLRPVDEGGLGMAQVLDYIGVPYEIRQQSLNFGT